MAILISADDNSLRAAYSLKELASVSALEMYLKRYSCMADITLGSHKLMFMEERRMAQILASFGRLSIVFQFKQGLSILICFYCFFRLRYSK